jgi:putative flippase GtrA
VDSPGKVAHNAAMLEATSRLRDAEVRRQFVRFLIVGVANTLITFVVYRLLLLVGVWYLVAAPVAWGVGALNGYVFNSRWTFAARDTTRARVLYTLVTAAGAGASSLLVWLFASAGLGKVEAFVAAIPIVTVSTFLANRLWTFADRER